VKIRTEKKSLEMRAILGKNLKEPPFIKFSLQWRVKYDKIMTWFMRNVRARSGCSRFVANLEAHSKVHRAHRAHAVYAFANKVHNKHLE
jgi:hypothetical protein